MKEYKHHPQIGHGGIKCPCCSPLPTVKASRVMVNRNHRRKIKQELRCAALNS